MSSVLVGLSTLEDCNIMCWFAFMHIVNMVLACRDMSLCSDIVNYWREIFFSCVLWNSRLARHEEALRGETRYVFLLRHPRDKRKRNSARFSSFFFTFLLMPASCRCLKQTTTSGGLHAETPSIKDEVIPLEVATIMLNVCLIMEINHFPNTKS